MNIVSRNLTSRTACPPDLRSSPRRSPAWRRGAASLLLLAFWACAGEENGSSTLERDSAGVTLLTLPAESRHMAWRFERTLEIPSADREADGFLSVADLVSVPGPDGPRIGVLDADAKQVLLYDDQGGLLARTGREGSGPGEFQYPLNIFVGPGDEIFVFDLLNRRLERFGPDLSLLPSWPFEFFFSGGSMAFTGPYLVLQTGDQPEEIDGRLETLTAASGADTLQIARFIREAGGEVELRSCGMRFSGMPPIFGPSLRWSANRRGTVAVAGREGFEIDLYRQPGFDLARRIRREVPAIPATVEMAQASIGESMKVMTPGGYRVCEAREVVEERGFAPVVPVIAELAISPEGSIWVRRRSAEGQEGSTDVLGPDGAYLGTLPPDSPFPDAFLDEGRILVIEEDELGLSSVVVYRIQR